MAKKFRIDGCMADRIFNKPLLLEENKARVIANYLEKRISGDFVINQDGMEYAGAAEAEPEYQCIEGVAIIQIIGTLVHRGSSMDAMSGLRSYQMIRQSLINAANDSNVKIILLEIDSGGGEVEGNFDLAKLIRQIHEEHKPVVAIANGSAFSGAFSLGVSAGNFFVTETGGVGSVGVIIQHIDVSKNNEMNGIVITNIVAGDRKAELSPNMPLSDSGRTTLQNEVNRIGDMFVALVANMRNISENIVKGTQAALLFGNESVNIGFVDGVISFDQLLESLIGISANTEFGTETEIDNVSETEPKDDDQENDLDFTLMKQRISEMNFLKKKTEKEHIEAAIETVVEQPAKEEQVAADPATEQVSEEPVETVSKEPDPVETAAAIADVCTEASMGHLAAGFIRSKTSLEDVKVSVGFKKEVMKICALAGKPDLAAGYLESGKSLKVIQDDLISKLASAQTDISNKPDPDAVNKDVTSAKNVVEADVEKRVKANQKTKGV